MRFVFRFLVVGFLAFALSACNEEECREGIGEGIDDQMRSSAIVDQKTGMELIYQSIQEIPLQQSALGQESSFTTNQNQSNTIAHGILDDACHLAASLARAAAIALCVEQVEQQKQYRRYCQNHCPRSCVIEECAEHAGDPTYNDVLQQCLDIIA